MPTMSLATESEAPARTMKEIDESGRLSIHIDDNIKQTKESDPKNSTKTHDETASFSELFSQAESYDYFLMALGIIGAMGTGVSIPIFNVIFGKILDALNDNPNSFSDKISELALDFLYIGICNAVSGFLQVCCWSIAGERQTQKFREEYVKAILSQEIGWFDECGAGELATRVADLTGKIEEGIGRKAGDFLQYVCQFVAAFIIALYFSWKLTLVLFCALPLIAFSGAFMINAITAAQNQSMEQYAQAGGLATETLGAIRTVTALNAQPDIINRYRQYLFHAMKVGIVKGFKVGLGNGGLFCACFLTYALGLWYGGKLIADSLDDGCLARGDCVTGGMVLSVFFCVVMGSMALGQIAPPMTSIVAAKAAVKPLLDVIRRKPLIDGLSNDGLKPEKKPSGNITLENVIFAYPSRPNIQVCKGYNLSIESGETVALVGASGSGKSTVINLLLRFYDPQFGCIRLDNTDIKQLNVRWLRANIGYVGQEPVLFSGTIADNIAYGLDPTLSEETRILLDPNSTAEEKTCARDALRDRVIDAAKASNAHEFITRFPQGYETDVGSSGSSMSGGQKQRIAIARALIKKPAVLLLDEATSALDAASERMVQESIDALQKSKTQTTIVIAHRLSTIRGADKIAVVNQGVIAEIGRHDELIAKNGLYADLVRLQMSSMEDILEPDDEETGNETGPTTDLETLQPVLEVEIDLEEAKSATDDHIKVSKGTSTPGTKSKTNVLKNDGVEDIDNTKEQKTKELSKEEKKLINKRIWAMIYTQWHWLALSFIGALFFGGIFPVWGLVLAKTQAIFYYANTDRLRARIAEVSAYFCVLGFISLVSSVAQFYGISQLGERISMKLRSDLFESIVRREIAFFDRKENAVGDLTTRLADDSRTVTKATGESTARQMQAICTLTVGLALGFSASWKVAFVVLGCFPISIAASAVQMQAIAGQQYDQDGGQSQGGVISTAFTNMRTVAAFSVQHKVLDDYSEATRNVRDKRIGRSYMAGAGFGGAQMCMFLTYALLFWYGSVLISKNQVTFEELMISILTLMLGALGLGTALSDMGDQKAGLIAAQRIFQTVEDAKSCPIDGLSTTGVKPTEHAQGRIELKGVDFCYPSRPNVRVCRNYNLVIEPGEVVALVGPSGSGKSTIMNLLLRFYDPLAGQVFLDGVDIREYNVRWLRSQIGYVGQEPVLFQGSVHDNIAKGREHYGDCALLSLEEAVKLAEKSNTQANDTGKVVAVADVETTLVGGDLLPGVSEDVQRAAQDSNAHDFIKTFPQQYDTDVGEGSIMVSGGQKQRIAIARALIKKPAVLLLDEATSALDAASERMVQESIDALQQNKMQTTIVIAHRLTTIKNADKIAVIDKGEVVEIGKHEELLALDGLYAQLWNKQKGHNDTLIRNNKSIHNLDRV